MIFFILIGLGVNVVVIGMFFYSIVYLIKVYFESIEEMGFGMIESLKVCGVSWW